MLKFYGAFYALAVVGLGAAALIGGKRAAVVPLVPMSFAMAYQYDMAYSTKMDRIIAEADSILLHERHLLMMPGGPLTLGAIDAAISAHAAAGGAAKTTVKAAGQLK
jgi:hypothetical protein